LIMKKLIFIFLVSPILVFSQDSDSLQILKNCNWELSKAKYLDRDGKRYQVFLDTDLNEAFLIKRIGRKKFKKVYL
jgi:hypothetical protein